MRFILLGKLLEQLVNNCGFLGEFEWPASSSPAWLMVGSKAWELVWFLNNLINRTVGKPIIQILDCQQWIKPETNMGDRFFIILIEYICVITFLFCFFVLFFWSRLVLLKSLKPSLNCEAISGVRVVVIHSTFVNIQLVLLIKDYFDTIHINLSIVLV